MNSGKVSENAEDYVLFEESILISTPSPIPCGSGNNTNGQSGQNEHAGVSLAISLESPSQRILPHNEPSNFCFI